MIETTIVELEDDERIRGLLERDRGWSAYAICDLEPPHRQHARYLGAIHEGQLTAVLLIYAPPAFTTILPCGGVDGIASILAGTYDLPASSSVLVQHEIVPALEQRYRLDRSWTVLRMIATVSDSGSLAGYTRAARLTADDLPAMQRLYACWPDTVFAPSMLDGGIYFGIYLGEELIAVAGTHAISARGSIAMLGNVFTHPDHRGQGLGVAVTGAVARAIFDVGVREIALNVREDNDAALRAYRRLGFSVHEPFMEGELTLRTGGAPR